MKILRLLTIAAVSALYASICASSIPSNADPLFGFVTVTGDSGGDDAGPDTRVVGEAIRYSGATAVRAGEHEAPYFPLNGRVGMGYIDRYTSTSTIQSFNNYGYNYFIWENEPDGVMNPDWTNYMNAASAGYSFVKGVNSNNKIIGGNLFTHSFNQLYSRGFKNASDVLGYHNYSDDPATGISIGEVKYVHDTAVSNGDGAKKIFLGEGWGPKREIAGLKRLFPDADISAEEIRTLRDFVVNGYWNLVTQTGTYDPAWVLGALFFTSNDNWGGREWAARAVPVYDSNNVIVSYTVDGYPVGLDIFPHFYNGGLLDIWGNAKDNTWDIFPGKGLAVNNSGFEYYAKTAPTIASDWTPKTGGAPDSRYGLDASIRHGGQRSQRLTLSGSSLESVQTVSVKGSVTPGLVYTAGVWAKTFELVKGMGVGATITLEFLNNSNTVVGLPLTATGLSDTTDWTRLTLQATAPANASKLRIILTVNGSSGRAWFDDAQAWQGTSIAKATLRGYVLNSDRNPVLGANVATTSGGGSATTDANGYFTINNVDPGVYDIQASKAGYRSHIVTAQLAQATRNRVLGFELPQALPDRVTGVKVVDPAVGGVMRLTWQNPTGPYDKIRIYRSSDPAQLGSLAHDNVQGTELWDTGLSDGTKYSYTFRTVINGVESTNDNHSYGISSGGISQNTYSNYAAAIWNHWAADYGQTFVATASGSLSTASATPGFGGSGGTTLSFSVHVGGPGGAQIGPSRSKIASGDGECTVSWQPGDIPVTAGQTYYLRITGAGGFAIYRSANAYPQGQAYMNGSPFGDQSSDIWSTIKIVQTSPVSISNASASSSPSGGVVVNWETSAPSSSQVEFGATEAYGNQSGLDPTPVTAHNVVLDGLIPGALYHFRVKSTRSGLPGAVSLDYYFTAPEPQFLPDISSAKALSDNTFISVDGTVSAAFDGVFYIQNNSQPAGIRVQKASHGMATGHIASVTGTLKTNTDGERYIDATLVAQGEANSAQVFSMSNKSLGGDPWQYNEQTGAGQQGVDGVSGLSTIGLLVKTWGVVTGQGAGYVTITDGFSPEGRIKLNGVPSPSVGTLISVVGPSSCYISDGIAKSQVLARSSADIFVLNP